VIAKDVINVLFESLFTIVLGKLKLGTPNFGGKREGVPAENLRISSAFLQFMKSYRKNNMERN
jgi:hypothetical protein